MGLLAANTKAIPFCQEGLSALEQVLKKRPDDEILIRAKAQIHALMSDYVDASATYHLLQQKKMATPNDMLQHAISERRLNHKTKVDSLLEDIDDVCAIELEKAEQVNDMAKKYKINSLQARSRIVGDKLDDAGEILRKMSADIQPESLHYDTESYFSDTWDRIKRLREIVAGRDIAIMALGPSLDEFEARLEEFKPYGEKLCFFGTSQYGISEKNICEPLGTNHPVIFETSPIYINTIMPQVIPFLERPEKNLMITVPLAMDNLKYPNIDRAEMEQKYGEKMLYFSMEQDCIASPDKPLCFLPGNSFSTIVPFACIANPSRIFLFGADAHVPKKLAETSGYYKGDKEYVNSVTDELEAYFPNRCEQGMKADCALFNVQCNDNIEALCALYKVNRPPIYNVGLESHLELFPKISYSECLQKLKEE